MEPLMPDEYKSRKDVGDETVYELTTADSKPEWGIAVADIGVSQLHFHRRTREVYVVVRGSIELRMGTSVVSLAEGDVAEIPPGMRHMARSKSRDRARVVVVTIPAWTQDDHVVTP